MALIDRIVKVQKAVYWPPAGPDQFGKETYGDPVEIGCFWSDTNELFIDGKTGQQVVSKSKAFVDRPLEVGGMLRLGAMETLTFPPDPRENDDPKPNEIRAFDTKNANVKGTKKFYKAMM